MKNDYPMRVYQDFEEDSFDWIVEFPDLPGCIGVGDTVEEALSEANGNKEEWLETAIQAGREVPLPSTSFVDNYSGKFNLRIPKSLHRELALQAELEGVSLNALCSTLLAKVTYAGGVNKSSESVKIVVPAMVDKQNNSNSDWKTMWRESLSNKEAC